MLRREAVMTWLVVLAGFFGAWSLMAATLPVPAYFLPPPTAVVSAFGELVRKGILPTYVAESLRRILTAAVLGLVVGVPAGLLLGMSRRVADFFYPLLNFFQSVSGIAWLPLFLVWFGFSERTILVAVNYTLLFPVIFNAMLGVRRRAAALRERAADARGVPVAHRPRCGAAGRPAIDRHRPAAGTRLWLASADRRRDARRRQRPGVHDLGMALIGGLWLVLDYFLLRPLEEATIARWGLIQR